MWCVCLCMMCVGDVCMKCVCVMCVMHMCDACVLCMCVYVICVCVCVYIFFVVICACRCVLKVVFLSHSHLMCSDTILYWMESSHNCVGWPTTLLQGCICTWVCSITHYTCGIFLLSFACLCFCFVWVLRMEVRFSSLCSSQSTIWTIYLPPKNKIFLKIW